jgi:FkbM family methyltransferase
VKRIFHLIKKRVINFGKLLPAIRYSIKVKTRIRGGARVYLHPVVFFKVILRLFSAPFFKLDSICLPGEQGFEKKLNGLIRGRISLDKIDGRRFFDFDTFKVFVPNFKNAENVILNDFREVYLDDVYAKHFLMGRPIKDNDVVLDLGANIGGFSLWACSQGAGVKCYAVEPHPEIRKELEENVALNRLEDQIVRIGKCISSKNEKLRMSFNEDVFTMTRISSSEGAVEVDAISVDSLVDSFGLTKLDIIKFDIEGAERIAIAGATETLKKFKPKLALSGYHLVDDVYFLIDQLLEIQPDYTIIVGSNMHIYAF